MALFNFRPLLVSLAAAVGFLVMAPPASAGLTGYDPCPGPNHPTYEWMGDMHGVQVSFPTIATAGPADFDGVVFGPVPPVEIAPGDPELPAISFQHGAGETDSTICAMVWAAKYLAGNGYITEIHQAPDPGGQFTQALNGIRATSSGIEFLRSPQNPYAAITDVESIGAGGSSMGSIVSSYIQGNPPPTDGPSAAAGVDLSDLDVDAIIAYDNLRRWLTGDPGAARAECGGEPAFEVTPRVPALGFAMDELCTLQEGQPLNPKTKQPGWSWWRENGVPSMSLVMRGFGHTDFSHNGDENQRLKLAYFTKRWYDRWLKDMPELDEQLLSPVVYGQPTVDILSQQFQSAACLGDLADTDDYSTWLEAGSPAPKPPDPDSCDLTADPIPDEPPVARSKISSLRISAGRRWIRAGGSRLVRIRVRNSGDAAAGNVTVRLRSSNRRVSVVKRRVIKRIGAGRTTVVTVRIRARGSATGKATITARTAGLRDRIRFRVR